MTYLLIVLCSLVFCHEVQIAHSLTFNLNTLLPLGSTIPLKLMHPTSLPMLFGMIIHLMTNWRLWSAMFLHANIMHILMNMIFLLFIGKITEPLFHHIRFLLLFLLTGFIGDLASAVIGQAYSVGASTALFGLLLAGWILARRMHANQLASSLMSLFIINIVFDFMFPDISLWGHLGGALAGICLGWTLRPHVPHHIATSLWVEIPLSLLVTGALTGVLLLW